MYKDKDKQRQAVKQATRRYRAKGVTSKGITDDNHVIPVIPKAEQHTDASQIEIVKAVHKAVEPEPQSYNPMMVGYVPPKPKD